MAQFLRPAQPPEKESGKFLVPGSTIYFLRTLRRGMVSSPQKYSWVQDNSSLGPTDLPFARLRTGMILASTSERPSLLSSRMTKGKGTRSFLSFFICSSCVLCLVPVSLLPSLYLSLFFSCLFSFFVFSAVLFPFFLSPSLALGGSDMKRAPIGRQPDCSTPRRLFQMSASSDPRLGSVSGLRCSRH